MSRAYLAADIPGIHLVHDVAERDKFIVAVDTVHTVIDGNEPDVSVGEIAFGVISALQIVTA